MINITEPNRAAKVVPLVEIYCNGKEAIISTNEVLLQVTVYANVHTKDINASYHQLRL